MAATEDKQKSSSDSNRQQNELSWRESLFSGFTAYNWINLLAFVVNIVITYGIGTAGWGGRPTNGELSDKYQTIVTPSSRAFLIWTLIFLMQGIWAVWQVVVPSQRKHVCVTEAMTYKYVLITLWQACWTLSFSFEVIWLSLVFMLLLCATLLWTVISLNAVDKSFRGWIIWQFPFSLHCGWILAATALNVNVTLVAYGASVNSQIAIASLCLIALLGASSWFLLQYPVDLTPPCVISWALGWIYSELKDPLESIVQMFSQEQIDGFQLGAIIGVGVILALVVAKAVYVLLVQRVSEPTPAQIDDKPSEQATENV